MSIDSLQTLEIIEVMENFIESVRPPEHIRKQLDISYKIEDQSILVFEVRPSFLQPDIMSYPPIAKTTFVKAQNYWKVFWMRADLKWHSYDPKPIVKSIKEFTKLIKEDKYGCFFG